MQGNNNTVLWLWLQQVCGAGSSMPELLLDAFDGSIVKLYEADKRDYLDIPFIKSGLIDKLCDKKLEKALEINAYCKNEGIGILTPESVLYPKRLARIQSKPIVLYYKGILVDLDKEVCIAEVGTRNMSEYGSYTSYSMAYDMAKAGAVVVSGMAKGVDGMAHRGALDAGGCTVAVLGCGIDRAYPAEHASLMKDIIKHGAVITEFWPFTAPYGKNFPMRNRIISGLSLGTLVTEAPSRSGALITAETALKQGREIFAVPGKLGELNSTGTNELIRNGAKMVTSASDVLLEYQPLYPGKINLNRITAIRSKRFVSPMRDVAAPTPYAGVIRDEDAAIRNALERSEIAMSENKAEEAPKETEPDTPESRQVRKLAELYGRTSADPNVFGKAKPYVRQSDNELYNDEADTEIKKKSKAKHRSEEAPALRKEATKPFTMPNDVTDAQRAILTVLMDGEADSDRFSSKTGLPINDVLVELTMLEINGYITALPGGKYKLN